jgi:hypothetical protein
MVNGVFFSFPSEHNNGGNSYMGTTHGDASQGEFLLQQVIRVTTQDTGGFQKQ